MSFVKSMDWITKNHPVKPIFYDAEILTIYFETNPDVVKKLLPQPLHPFEMPICAVMLANYPKTGFGVAYKESALFLTATHNNEMGEAELNFEFSNHDPWAEVEIVKILGASYSKGNNTMLPGEVVAEVDQSEFIPHAFMKLDILNDMS